MTEKTGSYTSILGAYRLLVSTILLGACVNSSGGVQNTVMTRDEAKAVLSAIQAEYENSGKKDVFKKIERDYRVSMMKCEERYLIEFSPLNSQGFDGGFQVTVDRGTLMINDAYFLPKGCGQSYLLD